MMKEKADLKEALDKALAELKGHKGNAGDLGSENQ